LFTDSLIYIYIYTEQKIYNIRIILLVLSVIKHATINEVLSAKNPNFSSLVYINSRFSLHSGHLAVPPMIH